MSKRRRIKVVIDTNVFVANALARNPRSPNRRVIRLWLVARRFKLVFSNEVKEEYLRIFEDVLDFDSEKIKGWRRRFDNKIIAKTVRLGARPHMSRDPDDNMLIATAIAARAQFIVTNDRDLLEIAEADRRRLKFKIITPEQFLEYWESSS